MRAAAGRVGPPGTAAEPGMSTWGAGCAYLWSSGMEITLQIELGAEGRISLGAKPMVLAPPQTKWPLFFYHW